MRVVSLLPSATEILSQIGGINHLVGRSHECDFPADLGSIPILTAQRTGNNPNPGVDAKAIDLEVKRLKASGESLYTLDEARLIDLKPDLILTQDLCSVCSIDLEAVERVAAQMPNPPRVLSLNPDSLEAVLDDVLRVGEAIGREIEARDEVVLLRGRLHSASDFVNPYLDGPIVGFMEWTDPIFIAGHWTVQMIERAGGRHPLNETVPQPRSGAAAGPQQAQRIAGKSIAVSPEVFAATNPEYLIISPCGLSLEQTVLELERLADQPWFAELPAVRAGRVAAVDGNQMFNRPGPRLVDAFEWMCGWLNERPEIIPEGFPWRQMEGQA